VTSVSNTPMSPVFQVGSLPNADHQQLLESIDYVPSGNSSTVQNLTAFMVATSDPDDYGQLNVYETPRGTTVTGPLQADSEIEQASEVSTKISLLDQHGSEVLLGNILTVPLDSTVLYIRPLYVTSSTNPMPQLRYVIAVFNQDVSIEPTLTGTGTTKSATEYLTRASTDYTNAQTALANGNLGLYQRDVNAMNAQLQLAQNALSSTTTTSTTTTTTTTTTTPKKS
jgi:uncharacterized membrane protein (UPF0182 family)